MTYIYVVMYKGRVSGEGYTSIEKAQAFIESRSSKPKQIQPMTYEGGYEIHQIKIVQKEDLR